MSTSKKCLFKFFFLIAIIISSKCYDNFNSMTYYTGHGGGNVIYLDRLSVYCQNGEALYGFQLKRPNSAQMYYAYGCKASESISKEEEYTEYTNWVPAADYSTGQDYTAHRLADLNVKCRNDFGLRGFKLESQCGKTICDIRYKYTCTALKVISCDDSLETPKADSVDGQNFTLEKQIIFLMDYYVLTGFRLKASYYYRFAQRDGRIFNYSVDYCKLRNVENEKDVYTNDKAKPTNPTRVKNENQIERENQLESQSKNHFQSQTISTESPNQNELKFLD